MVECENRISKWMRMQTRESRTVDVWIKFISFCVISIDGQRNSLDKIARTHKNRCKGKNVLMSMNDIDIFEKKPIKNHSWLTIFYLQLKSILVKGSAFESARIEWCAMQTVAVHLIFDQSQIRWIELRNWSWISENQQKKSEIQKWEKKFRN